MADQTEMLDVKVDIGILKTQVLTLSALCNKMDQVIEKLMEQNNRHIAKVYTDMDTRRLETERDIREIHDRIDTVLTKMETSNEKIMEEFKSLTKSIKEHQDTEKEKLDKLSQWKWMIIGGVLVLSWLLSRLNFDIMKLITGGN